MTDEEIDSLKSQKYDISKETPETIIANKISKLEHVKSMMAIAIDNYEYDYVPRNNQNDKNKTKNMSIEEQLKYYIQITMEINK